MTKTTFAQESLTSSTGATLNLYSSLADKPVGVVQVNHGLAEHASRYQRFAEFLKPHGFHLYAHDHRGHGSTKAPDAPARVFAPIGGIDKVLADIASVHDLIAERHTDLPVICFGHSMGGQISLNFTLRNSGRIAGLACWNANFTAGLTGLTARALLAWERFRLGSDVPSRVLPKLTFQAWARKFPDRKTEFDWLSRDEAEVAKYVADPLCGWDASVSMWQDIFELIFRGADDSNFSAIRRDLPISLIGGEHDPATSGGKTTRALDKRLAAMGFTDVSCRVYDKTRHESLNEVNRETVMEDFVQWAKTAIDKH